MRNRLAGLALALTVGAVVSGCTISGATDDPTAEAEGRVVPSPTAEATEATDMVITPSAERTGSPPSASRAVDSARGSSGAVSAPSSSAADTQTLAIEQRHPNGSVLRVVSLTVEDTAVTIGIEVVNGATRDFDLAYSGNQVGLVDDLGGTYEFIDPPQNENLTIPQRGTLTGDLVFFGIVDPDATTLRMQTNSSSARLQDGAFIDTATESENESLPHFSVDIPLDR